MKDVQSSTQSASPFIATRAQMPVRATDPIKGQLAFPIEVECPECWAPAPLHMHYCTRAKLTERQRMMS